MAVPRIRVSTSLPAPVSVVWADVSDLASHVEWMGDAASIEFTSPQRSGIGAAFSCVTRIGPFRTLDRMQVVEWEEGRCIGVQHVGLVTGTGRFVLEPDGRATQFTWEEDLRIPWWLGGRLASVALVWVWTRNLRRLQARFV
jgi:hypothetical protein